jgi:hypothetical protein
MNRCSIYYMVVFPNITLRPLRSSRDRSWPLPTKIKGDSNA